MIQKGWGDLGLSCQKKTRVRRWPQEDQEALKVLTEQGLAGGGGGRQGRGEEQALPCRQPEMYTEVKGFNWTHLPTPENMVPNGSASEVNVEVSETTFHAHQTVPAAQKQGSRENESMAESQEVRKQLGRCLTRRPFINADTGEFPSLFFSFF